MVIRRKMRCSATSISLYRKSYPIAFSTHRVITFPPTKSIHPMNSPTSGMFHSPDKIRKHFHSCCVCRRQNPLAGQVGFDPRLCYGDILLSFVYRPDEKISSSPLSTPAPSQPAQPPVTSTTSSNGASTTTSAITPSPSTVHIDSADPVSISKQAEAILSHQVQRPHDFVLTNFTNVRLCDSCNKKVLFGRVSIFVYVPRGNQQMCSQYSIEHDCLE